MADPTVAPKTRIESDDLLTLDDDLNVSVGALPGMAGFLKKPIDRFNSLSRAQKIERIVVGTLRYGPYAAFALLPAFALLLKLLYLGRRRRYPARPRLYGEHLVFAAHNHAFLFVAGALLYAAPASVAGGAFTLWALVYLIWATRVDLRRILGSEWSRARACCWSPIRSCSPWSRSALLIAAILLR